MREGILLGYEIGTGKEVRIERSHLIATGLTQKSGKTTTLEALIQRSGLKAVAFRTKVGEAGFSEGRIIRPFFKEKSDWQYIESLLEATMKEKLKFERSWIIKASKGAKTLKEVYDNCRNLQAASRDNSLQQGVYTNLIAYLEIILPQIDKMDFSSELELKDGISIMDLVGVSDEVQGLVIRSVLEKVLKEEQDTIVIIPEAWKFLPQDRGSPVKYIAEAYIRQGAASGNFLWIDSQDMAGIDKTVLKQASNWILGLQMERNEVQHTLDQIPLPNNQKPRPEEIMQLKVGHFIVCNTDFTKKVYVQPAWLDHEKAKAVAVGTGRVVINTRRKRSVIVDETKVSMREVEKLKAERDKLGAELTKLREEKETYRNKQIEAANHRSLLKERKQWIEKLHAIEAELKEAKKAARKGAWLFAQMEKILEKAEASQFPQEVHIDLTDNPSLLPPSKQDISMPPVDTPNASHTLTVPLEKNLMLQKLGSSPKRIYELLIPHPGGLTKPQIGLMTGLAHTSGSFTTYLSNLKTMGLIRKEGDIYKVV